MDNRINLADAFAMFGVEYERDERPAPARVFTEHEVAAVHVFTDKVIIISAQGGVTVIDRFDGTSRTA